MRNRESYTMKKAHEFSDVAEDSQITPFVANNKKTQRRFSLIPGVSLINACDPSFV